MIKRDELTDPNSCMNRAGNDEMTFVLLGRDAAAPRAIRVWALERMRLGKNRLDDPQIVDALQCAESMGNADKRRIPVARDRRWHAERDAYGNWTCECSTGGSFCVPFNTQTQADAVCKLLQSKDAMEVQVAEAWEKEMNS